MPWAAMQNEAGTVVRQQSCAEQLENVAALGYPGRTLNRLQISLDIHQLVICRVAGGHDKPLLAALNRFCTRLESLPEGEGLQ